MSLLPEATVAQGHAPGYFLDATCGIRLLTNFLLDATCGVLTPRELVINRHFQAQ